MPNNKNSDEVMMFSWVDDTVDPGFTVDQEPIDPDFSVDPDKNQNTDDNNQIPPPIIEDKPDEPPVCQRILNIECDIRKSLDLNIVYEDGTNKRVVITKGDKIDITYINEAKLEKVRGLILAILKGPKILNRITNKMQHIYSIKLDCSTRYSSKQLIIYCELIRELEIVKAVGEGNDTEIDVDYLEDNYFSKNQVDYLISWQDIDGTEIE